ncbi:50S ribosomal protein L5 [Candidatus Microgenomates bacterium]|nr:50S ribosomal protein L5 [Candidatus Microgenomates bacterium]
MSFIFEKYKKEIAPKLMKEMGIKNFLAVPRLQKIILNVGLGEALKDKGVINKVSEQLSAISGQKPIVTLAKKSIAGFKLRKGNPIGLKVTLRKKRMYNLFEKLVTIVLPNVKDFRGIPLKSFDGSGNYTLGIKEQTVFSELEFTKVDKIRGLEITIVTSVKDDKQGKRLLELMGMPFKKGASD